MKVDGFRGAWTVPAKNPLTITQITAKYGIDMSKCMTGRRGEWCSYRISVFNWSRCWWVMCLICWYGAAWNGRVCLKCNDYTHKHTYENTHTHTHRPGTDNHNNNQIKDETNVKATNGYLQIWVAARSQRLALECIAIGTRLIYMHNPQ